MKILLVHGIGYQEGDLSWVQLWKNAVKDGLSSVGIQISDQDIHYSKYDDLYYKATTGSEYWFEFISLLKYIRSKFPLGFISRDIKRISASEQPMEAYLGMVAKWISSSEVRMNSAKRLISEINSIQPDIIFAHSLGGLICYDTFQSVEGQRAIAGKFLVTFGCQLGAEPVRNIFTKNNKKIKPLPTVGYWINLYNKKDWVFVEPTRIPNQAKFEEIITEFDVDSNEPFFPINMIERFIDHNGLWYLDKTKNNTNLYEKISNHLNTPVTKKRSFESSEHIHTPKKAKNKKALIIGINEYPNSIDNLDGCVNDAYLISQTLQEFGFKSDDIRMLVNSRATSDAIFDRLDWLLEDAREGDERVFYYSGHGTQIPSRNYEFEVDHLIESLVPYNFEFDNPYETGVIDKRLSTYYSNLDYTINFTMILDCCHSGGMDKAGFGKVRSIRIPDDIRHRMEEWDSNEGWKKKKLKHFFQEESKYKRFAGQSGNTHLLGRALGHRNPDDSVYQEYKNFYGHKGPYLPVIFEACKEDELSQETRIGSTSHGIFTYNLVKVLNETKSSGFVPSLEQVYQKTVQNVSKTFKYQTPQLVAPEEKRNQPFRWQVGRQ